jgi:adenosylhomocysteine nucleosidase
MVVQELAALQARHSAIAGDWESGAIAYVAKRNGCPCLILRGVTDLIDHTGDETYGNINLFAAQAEAMMSRLTEVLPMWLKSAQCLFRNT